MTPSGIQVERLSHSFGKQPVLDSIDFTIQPGTIVGLLGPSGSGKTTLIRAMVGLLTPSEGSVRINGINIPSSALSSDIGYMAQFDALYEDLTGEQNMEFFAALFGLSGKAARKRITELFELTRLTGNEKKPVKYYSGGMKKRLSLAITLIHQPKILFLDEPTIGIDPVLRAEFWEEFYRLANEGATLILSTHVMDEAARCHQLGMIFEGKLLAWDTPEAIMIATGTQSVEHAFLSLREVGHA